MEKNTAIVICSVLAFIIIILSITIAISKNKCQKDKYQKKNEPVINLQGRPFKSTIWCSIDYPKEWGSKWILRLQYDTVEGALRNNSAGVYPPYNEEIENPGVLENFTIVKAMDIDGAKGFGTDEFCIYIGGRTSIFSKLYFPCQELTYISLQDETEGQYDSRTTMRTPEFFTFWNFDDQYNPVKIQNPFIVGNPSIASYGFSMVKNNIDINSMVYLNDCISRMGIYNFPKSNSNILTPMNIFRCDKEMSSMVQGEDYVYGECLRSYLGVNAGSPMGNSSFGYQDPISDYGVIRVAKPFVYSNFEDVYRSDYDTGGFTISSHTVALDSPLFNPLPTAFPKNTIYSIPAAWLFNGDDSKSPSDTSPGEYCYIAWVPACNSTNCDDDPDNIYSQLKRQQGIESEFMAPKIILGQGNEKRECWVLPKPNYAFLFRYRGAKDTWKGAVQNATCYENGQTNQPVNPSELYDSEKNIGWYPIVRQSMAQNLEEFKNEPVWHYNGLAQQS